jgi:prepilin-type N-terminal cleavage/methylation domain-containing protein
MNRRGFTMVELVVTLAVIALLIAIIAPAIMSAREAARRMECQNNLRQIRAGDSGYESEYGVLPNGMFLRLTFLPYLDLKGIYDQYDPSSPPDVLKARIFAFATSSFAISVSSDPEERSNSVETYTSTKLFWFGSPVKGPDARLESGTAS